LERVKLEGRRYLLAPTMPQAVPSPREIHTRYGLRSENPPRTNQSMEAALTLAFLYQVTGDEAYVAKAMDFAEVVCAQETWVIGPHDFNVIYGRVWPLGAKDDQVVFSYDIITSNIGQKLALVYDWLYPALNKAQRDRIRGAMLEKGITRVRGNYDYHWWAEASRCNWSGLCHSGVGMMALSLLTEDPQLLDVVETSRAGLERMLDNIGEDGGWSEGRSYWAYGVGESLKFMEALKRTTGGRQDLFKHRSLTKAPLDFALFGLTAGFGDSTGGPVGEHYMISKLVAESQDPHGAFYLSKYLRPGETVMDLIWPAPSVEPREPVEASRFFPSVDYAVLRKDFSPDSMTIAAKAGMHEDPHHGHMDCGTFNLTWRNLNFIGEVERSPYDEHYFGERRWEYLEAATRGHNVVMVNGEEQICAKIKDRPWRPRIGGKITHYQSHPGWAAIQLDASGAYEGRSLKSWRRAIALDKDLNIAIVVDQIACDPGAGIEVLYHPGVDFSVQGDRVILRAGGGLAEARPADSRLRRGSRSATSLRAEDRSVEEVPLPMQAGRPPSGRDELEMLVLSFDAYSLRTGRQGQMPVREDARITWVPTFTTAVKASSPETVIVSIFLPASLKGREGRDLAFALQGTAAAPMVVCTYQGKTLRYDFSAPEAIRYGDR